MIRAIQGYAADLLEAINLPMKAIALQIKINVRKMIEVAKNGVIFFIECELHKLKRAIEGKVEVVVAVEIENQ
jgi:hypothetical protein